MQPEWYTKILVQASGKYLCSFKQLNFKLHSQTVEIILLIAVFDSLSSTRWCVNRKGNLSPGGVLSNSYGFAASRVPLQVKVPHHADLMSDKPLSVSPVISEVMTIG